MNLIEEVKRELVQYINEEKANFFPRFFKTGPGEYGEGDSFIGITVPDQRKVAKKFYKHISLKELAIILKEKVHEYRLTALIMLVLKYEKSKDENEKEEIVSTYLDNLDGVNNWDLVDSSAGYILGAYLYAKADKSILYRFAESNDLWKQRIAIISTSYFIRKNEFEDTLKIAGILLNHKHDLIHKAVGWMLREVGNRDRETELCFLKEHYKLMPRTMLRYSIEKFEPELRQKFLKNLI